MQATNDSTGSKDRSSATATTGNNNDSDNNNNKSASVALPPVSWDDIFVDPHHDATNKGRQHGQTAGHAAGWKSGYELGRTKGLEYGMELGFYRGFVEQVACALLEEKCPQHSPLTKLEKTLVDLRRALDDFPSPHKLFAPQEQSQSSAGDSEGNSPSESSVDVRHELQRIRARFKLLVAQLGLQSHGVSLAQIMDEAATPAAAGDSGAASNDKISDDW